MGVRKAATAYVVMGICGCGKSTVAARFAEALGVEMLDGDDFHPPKNVEKMSAGVPLTDEDRAGWLARLNTELKLRIFAGSSVVLACSALKQKYRDALEDGIERCRWIFLKGSREVILDRMAQRRDHFMPATLVDSQLATLEEPKEAEVVDIAQSLDQIQEQLMQRFGAERLRAGRSEQS